MKELHYFGITDVGKKRTNNEDSFICQPLHNQNLIIACAIDGVGGYEGGEIAASITHESIINRLNQPFDHPGDALVESFILANKAIDDQKMATQQNEGMSCVATLALADIENNKFYFAHVGDTRLYLLRDNTLVKISNDQSFVGFLEDSGKLSEYDAMHHPKRNLINNALGFTKDITSRDYIHSGESPFLPGDIIMLCTDGLTDLVDNATMCSILTQQVPLKDKGEQLVTAANDAGGKDNITVVLVKNYKSSNHAVAYPDDAFISKKKADPEIHQSADVISKKDTKQFINPTANKEVKRLAFFVFLSYSSLLSCCFLKINSTDKTLIKDYL